MSIYAYVGLPGSGKSYGVVANQILPALKDGRIVVTNVPLYEDRIRESVTDGELREFPIDRVREQPELIDEYVPAGCVLVVDELWKLFPAGSKVDKVPGPFKRLLAEHRHMVDEQGRSTQIVFVTQDLAQIGAFARQLVEQTFLHVKLSHLGARGRYQVKVYHGAVTGASPPENRKIIDNLGRYEPKVYRLYKSHTMSNAEKDGADEASVDGRGNVWRRPMLWVSLVGGVVAMVWGGMTAYGAFKPDEGAAASVAIGRAAPVYRVPTGGVGVPVRASAARSWRVVGYVLAEGSEISSTVMLSDGVDRVTLPFDSYCRLRRDRQVDCEISGHRISSGPSLF